MEPVLSSFAISVAAGVALDLFPSKKSGVDKEIKLAYKAALKDWSKNATIREQNERRLKIVLREFLETSDGKYIYKSNQEIKDFLLFFDKRVAEFSIAYNYLMSIKTQENYEETKQQLSEIKEELSEIKESLELINKANIDPRDLQDLLDKLPFDKNKKAVYEMIESLYQKKEIPFEIREILILTTNKIYERTEELANEIEELKSSGENDLAETLERIKQAVENREVKEFLSIYEDHEKKEKEKSISLLRELIKSTIAIFAYGETKKLYSKFVHIAPTAHNRFKFAYFLQKFYFSDESIVQYEKCLPKYRDLVNQNSTQYLPSLANVLNNLGVLEKDRNKLSKALIYFEEVLDIYRKLLEKFPRAYLSDLSSILNNLGNIETKKEKFSKALLYYNEALEINRLLAKENPPNYSPDLASTLCNLGTFENERNKLLVALAHYKEALGIYRKLLENNLFFYRINLSDTLKNIAIVQFVRGEKSNAFINFSESIKIMKILISENRKFYEIEYAMSLTLGVELFRYDKINLLEAKDILEKYSHIHDVKESLNRIDDLIEGKETPIG